MQSSKKKKPQLVYKPFHKGPLWNGGIVKQALRLFCYFLFFTIMYVIVGSSLTVGGTVVRVIANGLILLVCAGVVYNSGIASGDGDVALGEIVHTRLQEGKPVAEKDKKQCYHPLRGLVVFGLAILPVLLMTVPAAIGAEKQLYNLQALPDWVKSFSSHDEIAAPLAYYQADGGKGLMDVLKLLSRLMVYPFICMVSSENLDALLWIDRLAPVLAILPGVAYPIGYMAGPASRAKVHGDIARNKRKQIRKQKKQVQARRAAREEKNELI